MAPPIVDRVLQEGGHPLDAHTRAFMEPRFDHSFADVRVHDDARAAESARAVGAHAYAVGRDIVFGEGRYAPQTSPGRRLIAHELTHTIQQSGATTRVQAQLAVAETNDVAEREADSAADAVLRGTPARVTSTGAQRVARQDGGTPEKAEKAGKTEEAADPYDSLPTAALRTAGYTGANPQGVIRIAWTLDDGPTEYTLKMRQSLGGRPATWFIMWNQLQKKPGEAKNLQRLKKLQDAGDEIAIHSPHSTEGHVCWFPVENPGCKEVYKSTAAAMADLVAFTAVLRKAGLKVSFVRLPTGLHDQMVAYLTRKGSSTPEADFKKILDAQNLPGKLAGLSAGAQAVKADFDLLMKTLADNALHLWGGDSGDKEVAANSWEAESSGVPERTDNVTEKFANMVSKIEAGTRKKASFIVLGHDTTSKDVAEVAKDIKEMEQLATDKKVRVEYFRLAELYREVRGKEPRTPSP